MPTIARPDLPHSIAGAHPVVPLHLRLGDQNVPVIQLKLRGDTQPRLLLGMKASPYGQMVPALWLGPGGTQHPQLSLSTDGAAFLRVTNPDPASVPGGNPGGGGGTVGMEVLGARSSFNANSYDGTGYGSFEARNATEQGVQALLRLGAWDAAFEKFRQVTMSVDMDAKPYDLVVGVNDRADTFAEGQRGDMVTRWKGSLRVDRITVLDQIYRGEVPLADIAHTHAAGGGVAPNLLPRQGSHKPRIGDTGMFADAGHAHRAQGVRKNSAGVTAFRPRLNLIEGANVTLTVSEDATDDEIDVTIASSGGAASIEDNIYLSQIAV